MNVPDLLSDDLVLRLRITGDGFAWNDTIHGVVTLHPRPTESVTYSVVSVAVVTQNRDGFASPTGFAGMRDPLNPLMSMGLPSDGLLAGAPPETEWDDVVIARDVVVSPGSSAAEIAFALPVSPRIALGDLCFVAARAAATNGVDNDRHAAAPFVLLPPPAVQAVQNALRGFGDFRAVSVTNAPGESGDASVRHFTLDYRAPEALQSALNGVCFDLSESETHVSGMVVINPQEHSLADHLRAMVHADRVRSPVHFDRAELYAAGTAGLPAASVTARLHELLDPFLHPVAPQ